MSGTSKSNDRWVDAMTSFLVRRYKLTNDEIKTAISDFIKSNKEGFKICYPNTYALHKTGKNKADGFAQLAKCQNKTDVTKLLESMIRQTEELRRPGGDPAQRGMASGRNITEDVPPPPPPPTAPELRQINRTKRVTTSNAPGHLTPPPAPKPPPLKTETSDLGPRRISVSEAGKELPVKEARKAQTGEKQAVEVARPAESQTDIRTKITESGEISSSSSRKKVTKEEWAEAMTQALLQKLNVRPEHGADVLELIFFNASEVKKKYDTPRSLTRALSDVANLPDFRSSSQSDVMKYLRGLLLRHGSSNERGGDTVTTPQETSGPKKSEERRTDAEKIRTDCVTLCRIKTKELIASVLRLASQDPRETKSILDALYPGQGFVPSRDLRRIPPEYMKANAVPRVELEQELGGRKYQTKSRKYLWGEVLKTVNGKLSAVQGQVKRHVRRTEIQKLLSAFELKLPNGYWKPLGDKEVRELRALNAEDEGS